MTLREADERVLWHFLDDIRTAGMALCRPVPGTQTAWTPLAGRGRDLLEGFAAWREQHAAPSAPGAELRDYLGAYTHPRWYLACVSCSALWEDDGEQDQSALLEQAWAEGWRPRGGAVCCPGCATASGRTPEPAQEPTEGAP